LGCVVRLGVVLTSILLSTVGFANASTDCTSVSNDLDRLACYDAAAGRAPVISELRTDHENWIVEEKSSPLTDEKTISCRFNNRSTVSFVVRCHENVTAAYFTTDCHMADIQGHGKIEFRTDKNKAEVINADASTNNRSLGLWSGGKAIPFVKKLLDRDQLVARMTPFSDSPFVATFDISGISKIIEPLRSQCKW
jgi:type VI secretion system protein VasI